MRALVVYESMFGNTKLIAEAIAGGLARHSEVESVEVGQAPAVLDSEIELLVVGGPTHAFGLSRPGTRKSAAEQIDTPLVSAGIGIREWVTAIGTQSRAVSSAAFDTRIDKPRFPGSAAAAAAKRLGRLGFHQVLPPESFFVEGSTGPLLAGEYERAHRWGESVGSKLAETAALSR
jgi:hypothetical protein